VFTVDDLMSEAEWRKAPYYIHWCQPYNVFHVMGADISTPNPASCASGSRALKMLEVFRRKSASSARPAAALRRALHMHNLLDRSESLGMLYSKAIGRLSVATIVLDETGKVLDQNLIAQEILDSGDGLKLVGGRLEATYPATTGPAATHPQCLSPTIRGTGSSRPRPCRSHGLPGR
jgi:hypothetical protein